MAQNFPVSTYSQRLLDYPSIDVRDRAFRLATIDRKDHLRKYGT
jgi:hypothetical protein